MAEPVEHDLSWAIFADACFHPTDAFIGRVQRAYRLATARVPRWVSFGPEAEKLHQQLLSGGNETIRQIMTDPGTTHLYYGMDSLYPNGLSDEPQHARAYANGCASLVTNLAEAVGARRAHNPEAPGARANGNDLEALLADLDRHLGVKLAFPNPFPREIGLKTSRGIASVRAVYAIYQAWRLRELCRLTKGRKVLEIGAGTGRAAYYALCLGLDDYTIIDLPATLVASSCFLAAALGEGKIWMVGDPVEERAGRLRLLPATETGALPECFDVIVNVDSLPEMPREIAEEYFVEACSKSSASCRSTMKRAAFAFQTSRHVLGVRNQSCDRSTGCGTATLKRSSFARPPILARYRISDPTRSQKCAGGLCAGHGACFEDEYDVSPPGRFTASRPTGRNSRLGSTAAGGRGATGTRRLPAAPRTGGRSRR